MFEYFVLFNVVCVGGLWMVFKDKVVIGDWVGIMVFVKEVVVFKW